MSQSLKLIYLFTLLPELSITDFGVSFSFLSGIHFINVPAYFTSNSQILILIHSLNKKNINRTIAKNFAFLILLI